MAKAYLEPTEIEKLEEAAQYLRDRLLIRLLFHLGCRVSEALGIRADDIDFKYGTVTIEHLKAKTKHSCPECGARLGKMHKFCPVCGIKVEKTVVQEQEHRKVRTLPLDKVLFSFGCLPLYNDFKIMSNSQNKSLKFIGIMALGAIIFGTISIELVKNFNWRSWVGILIFIVSMIIWTIVSLIWLN